MNRLFQISCKWCFFSRWSSKLKKHWRNCLWQHWCSFSSSLVQTWLFLSTWCALMAPFLKYFFSIFLLQRCYSWGHSDRRRVPTTQQDCEVQRPQSDKSCWSQETVPEVLGLTLNRVAVQYLANSQIKKTCLNCLLRFSSFFFFSTFLIVIFKQVYTMLSSIWQ